MAAKGSAGQILYVINVDWYFILHWVDRAIAARKAGYNLHLATSFTSAENEKKIRALGIQVHPIPFSRRSLNPLTDLRALSALYTAVQEVRPSIIHSITLKPVLYAGIISRIFQIPCIASVPGLGFVFATQTKKYQLIWTVLERLLKVALNNAVTVAIFENNHDLEQLASQGTVKIEQARVIPGAGVDLCRFHPTPEPAEDPIRVLFAARLLASKGLALLVNCIAQMRRKGLNIELIVAGIVDAESHDAMPLTVLEHWHSQGDIVWLGQVDNVEQWIARSHIVCLPTTYGEGIPRILIEASASARAVITTDVPGCRDFVKHGIDGILVPPNDQRALQDALYSLSSNRAVRDFLGANGREKVVAMYSNEAVISETLEIYERVSTGRKYPFNERRAENAKKITVSTVLFYTDLLCLQEHIVSLMTASLELNSVFGLSVQVYLIDNSGSERYTAEIKTLVADLPKQAGFALDVVAAFKNIGYGRANNLVIHRLDSQYHLVVNPDVVFSSDALVAAVRCMRDTDGVGLITPRVYNGDLREGHVVKIYPDCFTLMLRYLDIPWLHRQFGHHISAYECRRIKNEAADVALAGGCFFFMRTKIFKALGGFDPRYFMYFEDFDLCLRLSALARIRYQPEVTIAHYGGGVRRKGIRHHFYFVAAAFRFFTKNGWLFYRPSSDIEQLGYR